MSTSPKGTTNDSMPPSDSVTDAQDDANHSASISWPLNRPTSRGKWTPDDHHDSATAVDPQRRHNVPTFPVSSKDLLPGQTRSHSDISVRAFALGQALGVSLATSLYLAVVSHSATWRASCFVAALALFHFLEFWTTARYNTPTAKVASFLFSNGKEYQMAHSAAMLECLVTHFFCAGWHDQVNLGGLTTALGIALVALGQAVRTVAMAQAGTNFNHMVQSSKRTNHELVTAGVYAWLRHPSYFGFFWWGLGTQLMLGNAVCFLIYAAVLWRFFSRRIAHEEKFLVNFFGDEYRQYRARTRVAIPFIR